MDEIREKDLVALTLEALKSKQLKGMMPRKLHDLVDWPNEFVVMATFQDEDEGLCLTLFPCCFFLRNRKDGKPHCAGHPAQYFEKIGSTEPEEGERHASVSLPFLGEILRADYKGGKHPEFKGNIVGLPPVEIRGIDLKKLSLKDLLGHIG